MPVVLGPYSDPNLQPECAISSQVRIVRLDDGSLIFEKHAGTDAMGVVLWHPIHRTCDADLFERAAAQHAAKIADEKRSDPVVAELLALLVALTSRAAHATGAPLDRREPPLLRPGLNFSSAAPQQPVVHQPRVADGTTRA